MEVATLLSPISYSFPAMKRFWGSHLGVLKAEVELMVKLRDNLLYVLHSNRDHDSQNEQYFT